MHINEKHLCDLCFTQLNTGGNRCENCVDKPHSTGALMPGTILAGRYAVGNVLGKGGFGITYLGYDIVADCTVAIKEFYPSTIAHRNDGEKTVYVTNTDKSQLFKSHAERFYKEAELLSKFRSYSNIINVISFFYENNTAYFVMEYLDGMDVSEYLRRNNGMISEKEAILIAVKTAEALKVVHKENILHRDVAPDNIYICNNGQLKLIDFGAARQVSLSESMSLTEIVKSGFAPFEQYQKKGRQGPWTDIYALGATTYYMIKGKRLDDAPSRTDDDKVDFSGISDRLSAVIKKMIAMDISKRYQNVQNVIDDLTMLLNGSSQKYAHQTESNERATSTVEGKEEKKLYNRRSFINKSAPYQTLAAIYASGTAMCYDSLKMIINAKSLEFIYVLFTLIGLCTILTYSSIPAMLSLIWCSAKIVMMLNNLESLNAGINVEMVVSFLIQLWTVIRLMKENGEYLEYRETKILADRRDDSLKIYIICGAAVVFVIAMLYLLKV